MLIFNKRVSEYFDAYEIVRRLKAANENDLLHILSEGVSEMEKKRGHCHRVFELNFDAKKCVSPEFIYQKSDYIHHNPTKGKWMSAKDFLQYEHSPCFMKKENANMRS